jgi:hypothetical protein
MNGRTPQQLQSLLENHFNMSELRQLAFALDIDHEDLEGNTKPVFILSLISYAQRHGLIEALDELAEKGESVQQQPAIQSVRQQSAPESFWGRKSFGTKIAIVSTIVTLISIILALVGFFPEALPNGNSATVAPPSADKILLQVQVNSAADQSSIDNATVRLVVAGQIFSPEQTDSNGLAVFELPVEMIKEVVNITVEQTGYESKDQNITLDSGLRPIEFQLRPLP